MRWRGRNRRKRAARPAHHRHASWLFALALTLYSAGMVRDRVDAWIDSTDLPPLVIAHSVEVLDREGHLLRAFTVGDGRWRLATGLGSVDPDYVEMLIRYEDKRFRDHPGVDPVAMLRAVWLALRNGRIVSGGSTLTMQVARLLEDGPTGSWQGKLRQVRLALALERVLTKDQILALYLDRAPFGGNLEGVRAAAYAWFGKPPTRLTTAQAALLVAIPQAPVSRRPDRAPLAAQAARDRVLRRMVEQGVVSADEARAAMTEPSPDTRRAFPLLSPHLAGRVRASDPFAERHVTTLDVALQTSLEALAARIAADGGDRLQIAILVADHTSGEIRASVGSAGFEADGREGFLDMTMALRSPGSTLKPLIYGLAFDRGLAQPETILTDRPMDFDGYRPVNFDGLFRGEVPAAEALRLSLNLPAVALLDAMGPQHLIAGLRRAGASPALPGGAPGLAVGLGGVGLSLRDLVGLYAAIAQGGTRVDLRWHAAASAGYLPTRVLDRAAAWQVADILRGTPRPPGVRGDGIAFKTGTSYGHRDAWAVGFDGAHVVGVWLGRADGTPVPGAFGGDVAAPVLFQVFERLGRVEPLPQPPPETLLLSNAALPEPLRRFDGRGGSVGVSRPEIAFPPDGALVEGVSLAVRVRDGAAPFTWLANGAPVLTTHRREAVIEGLGPGFSNLTVIDATGRADRAAVELRATP